MMDRSAHSRPLRTRLARALGWAVCLLAAIACRSTALDDADSIGPIRLVLHDLDGEPYDVERHLEAGERVVLVFLQPNSRSCETKAPEIAEILATERERFRVFAVAMGPARVLPSDRVRETFEAWDLGVPILRDEDLAATNRFSVAWTPSWVVIDEQRRLLHASHRPPSNWNRLAPR